VKIRSDSHSAPCAREHNFATADDVVCVCCAPTFISLCHVVIEPHAANRDHQQRSPSGIKRKYILLCEFAAAGFDCHVACGCTSRQKVAQKIYIPMSPSVPLIVIYWKGWLNGTKKVNEQCAVVDFIILCSSLLCTIADCIKMLITPLDWSAQNHFDLFKPLDNCARFEAFIIKFSLNKNVKKYLNPWHMQNYASI
jgi:hypothetical protein